MEKIDVAKDKKNLTFNMEQSSNVL